MKEDKFKLAIISLTLLILLIAISSFAIISDLNLQITTLKEKNNNLNLTISSLEGEIKQLESQIIIRDVTDFMEMDYEISLSDALFGIRKYIEDNSINIHPGDPEELNIEAIGEGWYNNTDVFIIFLDCCYLGDTAFIDKETGEVIGYNLGAV